MALLTYFELLAARSRSEMDRRGSREASQRGGAGQQQLELEEGGGPLQRRPSTLQLLAAAAKVYVDSSRHGSRGGGAAAPAVQAAPALAGAASAPAGALRQVADDGSVSRRQRLLHFGHLPGAADASSASSIASAGSGAADGGEGRRRGAAAAVAAAGLSPPRSAAGSGSARSRPAASSLGGSRAASGFLLDGVEGLLPQRVVQRRSLENPLLGGTQPPGEGRSWTEMQAQLRQATPRSSTASREGSRASGTPSTRVVRLKPLQ
jgi:hypothetical protein